MCSHVALLLQHIVLHHPTASKGAKLFVYTLLLKDRAAPSIQCPKDAALLVCFNTRTFYFVIF